MSWTEDEAESYFAMVQGEIRDDSIRVRGELWDYGAKIRMKADWPEGEWEFAKDWSVDEPHPPASVAAIVVGEVQRRRQLNSLSEVERRAFEFGPWLRRIADAQYEGNLGAAIVGTNNSDRWKQHLDDLSNMRAEHRPNFVETIRAAGGREEDLAAFDD